MLSRLDLVLRVNERVVSDAPVHRVFCIDCSGSMSGDLPDMRTHLKNKLPTAVRPQDRITIIWFSGRQQCGVVLEHVAVDNALDLSAVQASIDRYIHVVGSTGFVEPIRLAREVSDRYPETFQIFFLTDGAENTSDRETCKQAFRDQRGIPMVIVEYGYVADRAFLAELAECSDAALVFNEDFERYSTTFDSYLSNRVTSSYYEPASSDHPVIYFQDGEFRQQLPSAVVRIPITVSAAWSINDQLEVTFPSDDRMATDEKVGEVYLAMLYGISTRNHVVMKKCAEALGDVALLRAYSTCFSRQDYANLNEYVLAAARSPVERFRDGVDISFRVKDENFTVIKLLHLLANDQAAFVFPYHPSFRYRRISKEVKKTWPHFVANQHIGARFTLVSHQSRANLSLGCQIHGHSVTEMGEVAAAVGHRNYSIVKDGIKNVDVIPISVSEEVFTRLVQEGCIPPGISYSRDTVYQIEIRHLPVVDRQYAMRRIDAKTFTELHVHLHQAKTEMKYLKAKRPRDPAEDGSEERVRDREDQADRVVRDESVRDFYTAPELHVKIKGCSSIPPVNETLNARLEAPYRLTASEQFFLPIHLLFKENGATDGWIAAQIGLVAQRQREILATLEDIKVAMLVAGAWFDGMAESEHRVSVEHQGRSYEVSVGIYQVKVYLD